MSLGGGHLGVSQARIVALTISPPEAPSNATRFLQSMPALKLDPRVAGEVRRLTKALAFAAEAHRNHRRKGASQEPYINHLIEVVDVVASVKCDDIEVLIAALLHDVLEDTNKNYQDVAAAFGGRVANIVQENTDDMTLQKSERRRARIESIGKKSREGRLVKFADLISNLRAIAVSPPAGWSNDRRHGYLDSCRGLVDAGRGANVEIERIFDETARSVEVAIRAGALDEDASNASVSRALETTIGQAVHLVYVPNSKCAPISESDVDLLCQTIARSFPSATVQTAEGIHEHKRRPMLIARIRTDSSEAVVALAQQLCLDFDEPFVGIEVDGRYIRIYGDDTV